MVTWSWPRYIEVSSEAADLASPVTSFRGLTGGMWTTQNHTYLFTFPVCEKGSTVSFNKDDRTECCCNKRVQPTSLQGPSPNTSAAAWQGPRRHLKGTTVEKINLASSPLGPAAESERGRRLHESRAGIPILANCFVGRLPKTVMWRTEEEERNHIAFQRIPSCFLSTRRSLTLYRRGWFSGVIVRC